MTPGFPHDDPRDLMERLDQVVPPHTRAVHADGDEPLVDAARRLAQAPMPALSDHAINRIEDVLRARLAETSPLDPYRPAASPVPSRPPWQPALRLLRYAAMVALVLLGLMAGAVRASANTLPGDTLYPVKRAIESARLALASDHSEPALRVELAERRVDEFERLLAQGDAVPRLLEEAASQLEHTLDLLARGYGSPDELNPRVRRLAQQTIGLAQQATPLAAAGDQPRLAQVTRRGESLQARLTPPEQSPTPAQDAPPTATTTPTHTVTPAPTATVPPTTTATPAFTSTPVPTAVPTTAPSASPAQIIPPTAVQPPAQPDQVQPPAAPSRTPPGHGPTPGLGDNPPGHGGSHPGQGNDGQPPGQETQAEQAPNPGHGGQPPGQAQPGNPDKPDNPGKGKGPK